MAMIDKDQVAGTYGGMQSDNTVPGAENHFDASALKGFVLDDEGKL